MPGGARDKHEKSAGDEFATEQPAPSASPAPAVVPAVPFKKVPQSANDTIDSGKPPVSERSKAEKNSQAAALIAPSEDAGDEKFTYYLQAGAFREIADAEASKAKLAMMGVAATISERRSELGSLYRVRIGPYGEVESMNRIRTRLSDNGVDAAVVRVPK